MRPLRRDWTVPTVDASAVAGILPSCTTKEVSSRSGPPAGAMVNKPLPQSAPPQGQGRAPAVAEPPHTLASAPAAQGAPPVGAAPTQEGQKISAVADAPARASAPADTAALPVASTHGAAPAARRLPTPPPRLAPKYPGRANYAPRTAASGTAAQHRRAPRQVAGPSGEGGDQAKPQVRGAHPGGCPPVAPHRGRRGQSRW